MTIQLERPLAPAADYSAPEWVADYGQPIDVIHLDG